MHRRRRLSPCSSSLVHGYATIDNELVWEVATHVRRFLLRLSKGCCIGTPTSDGNCFTVQVVKHSQKSGIDLPFVVDESARPTPRSLRTELQSPGMATSPRSAVTERVWSRLPEGCRQVLEDELSPTDLQSLLLSLAHTRSGRIRPAEVLRRWKSDRFVRPATIDPGRLSEVENRLWRRLRDTPFEGLALSPVTSLGTCTSVGGVDQNRIVSTVRSSEVVSDPCNVLALEAALRRRSNNDQAHLASCHRVLRAQQFVESDAFAHFVIFALVSSARDSGSARTEAELLIMHLGFWQQVLDELLGPTWGRFAYTLIGDQSKGHQLVDMIRSELPAAPLTAYPERTQGIGYYHTAAFKILANTETVELEIGDGGFVGWTAELIPDAKERCLTSCVAPERLAGLMREN